MIEFTVKWFDLAAYTNGTVQPVVMHERPIAHDGTKPWAGTTEIGRVGKYWVPQTCPLPADNDLRRVQWTFCHSGDVVRIPVWAFRTVARGDAAVWGLALQVGTTLMVSLQQITREEPTEIVLFLGDKTVDLYPDNAVRCFAGFAIRTIN